MAKNDERSGESPDEPGPQRGGVLRHWAIAGFALLGLLGWKALDDAASQRLFFVNRSPSLPNWAFLVKRGTSPVRGDTVFFAPPTTPLVTRHFGVRPAPFGKIVYGMPGDVVEHEGADVFVRAANGQGARRRVATMKSRSQLGEALEAGPVGTIPAGCYYVGSPHKDGFDSRYAAIGFICRSRIIGTAEVSVL
ncbi:S26 family signal peptidase [Novosphingobium sp. G106]|uniref:S26 family signal peptidase n=1 Tax=Novosphingobium sp. G106 TaxID=2849500 RepID=UPI001C2DB54C|nr:S26 family signal peptidase [Novosphingobium sp. G106]MBV1692700.1 S26 family signal peptidase [Novosphingobium sp. G106]